MNPIHPRAFAIPSGHYSYGLEAGGFVFVSGQLPATREGHALAAAAFDLQARQALENCAAVLAAAGCSLSDVVKTTAYLVGIENWPAFNQVYAERMGAHRPARTVVPVPALHHGYLVEIDMIARKPDVAGRA